MTSEIDLADAPEERLIMRFLACWEEVAGGRPMPALGNFSAPALEPYKPFSVLIDLQDGYENPVIRHVGRAIVALMGKDCRGQSPHDVPRRSILSRVTDHFYEILANRAPIGFEAAFEDAKGAEIPYRGILTPLGEEDETITFILAVINWMGAEEAPAAMSPMKVETSPPAEEPAPEYPSPVYQGDPEADLADLRNAAQGAGRSRTALYDLLADVYGFYQSAGQSPGYRDLLDEHGIRPQARAPFTAALKLVLGSDYDKTRITEYAAAMNFAARKDLDQDRFRQALEMTPGGLKAMVRAERAARRNGSAQGADLADESVLANIAAAATIDNFVTNDVLKDHGLAGGTSDYVLLLARKSGPDQLDRLDILDALPARPGDLKRFVAKQ
jgi:hypothetical protein